MSADRCPFHLAIPVNDLEAARDFYIRLLGCAPGRAGERWLDLDFHGHQLVCHLVCHLDEHFQPPAISNPVDGHAIPIPHFGVVLAMPAWRALASRLERAGVAFVVEPHVRFQGQPGEQATLFLRDPSGNAIEIKGFANVDDQLFAR